MQPRAHNQISSVSLVVACQFSSPSQYPSVGKPVRFYHLLQTQVLPQPCFVFLNASSSEKVRPVISKNDPQFPWTFPSRVSGRRDHDAQEGILPGDAAMSVLLKASYCWWYYCLLFFKARVSLCGLDCLGTPSVEQADLKLTALPAPAAPPLKVCTTTTGLVMIFFKTLCFR